MMIFKCDVCKMTDPLINPYVTFSKNINGCAMQADCCKNCWDKFETFVIKNKEQSK